jgi:hypothetical protein
MMKNKYLMLMALALVVLFITGCETWNDRIGKFSYDQVCTKIGRPPDHKETLPNGDIEAKWISGRWVFIDNATKSRTPFCTYDRFLFDTNKILRKKDESSE